MRGLVAAYTLVWLVPSAHALDPNRLTRQYIRDEWTEDRGYPGGAVNALAQTPDGYLWIGAENGLVRFDGFDFRLFNQANTDGFPASPVLGLATDPDGNLWIRLQSRELLRYRDSAFEPIAAAKGVTTMGPGLSGDILLVRPNDPLRYRSGKFARIPADKAYVSSLAISIAETADHRVWIGTRDTGAFGLLDGRALAPPGIPDRKVNCLLAGDGDSLWVGTDHGLAQWNGRELTQNGLPPSLRTAQIMAIARDHDSNVWLGTANGLVRIVARGTVSPDSAGGARSDAVSAIFEDREGNLWTGTSQGIVRYRDSAFLTYPSQAGSSSENEGPVYTDSAGRTWFGPSTGGLFLLTNGERRAVREVGLGGDIVYSIAGAPDGIWVGRQRGGLTHLRTDVAAWAANTFTVADGLAAGPIYAVHRCRDGTVWAGSLNSGVSRWSGGRMTTYTAADGLASNTVSAIEEGPDGTMWFATSNGLTAYAQHRWRIYTSQEGLPPGRINCLSAGAAGVLWIGTDLGLAALRDGRVQVPRDPPEVLQEEVLGVSDDGRGDLWIATSKHVARLALGQFLKDGTGMDPVREFGPADGIPAPAGIRRNGSVTKDGEGRIWLSLRRGISVVDPARLRSIPVPAIVQIQSVAMDGRTVNAAAAVKIPPGQQRLRINFLALSLSVPERVQYRYRLDKFDGDWSEPSSVGVAVYTNLSPGSYRFRVVASNSEGIWNSAEAATTLHVAPWFWQTPGFRVSGAVACILLVLTAYRVRLGFLTERLRVRFEERLAERTRIAQDLHDTVLQGLLAASMQLHVAFDGLPAGSKVEPELKRVLSMLEQVVLESRDAVRGLRTSVSTAEDLDSAFSKVREELPASEDIGFRIVIDGPRRPLRPLIRDEVYRIGREAIKNAFRHSRAAQVEVEINYRTHDFRLNIRDDGCGIDEEILRSGRDGHWGLVGMRESAEKIGAQLKVFSRPAAGTELELAVPGHIAFHEPDKARKRRWFARWNWRRAAEKKAAE